MTKETPGKESEFAKEKAHHDIAHETTKRSETGRHNHCTHGPSREQNLSLLSLKHYSSVHSGGVYQK